MNTNIKKLQIIDSINRLNKLVLSLEEFIFIVLGPVTQVIKADNVLFINKQPRFCLKIFEVFNFSKKKEIIGKQNQFFISHYLYNKKGIIVSLKENQGFQRSLENKYLEPYSFKKGNILIQPLYFEDTFFGAIEFFSSKVDSFSEEDIYFTNVIASQIVAYIKEKQYFKEEINKVKVENFSRNSFSNDVIEMASKGKINIFENSIKIGDIIIVCFNIFNFSKYFYKSNSNIERIIKEWNYFLENISRIILKHKGTIDCFSRDGILSFWGAPISYEKDLEFTLNCILEIKQMFQAMQGTNKLPKDWELSISIHKGKAIVGNLNKSKYLSYTAIGESIDIALQMCKLSQNNILVSKSIKDKLKSKSFLTFKAISNSYLRENSYEVSLK